MVRVLDPDALAKIQAKNAGQPITIIEVEWEKNSNNWKSYADKDVGSNVSGRILSMSPLDSVVALSLNETNEEIELVLDDTDGRLKDIIDVTDIHMSKVRVYQWFEDIPLDKKFLVFPGRINSPIRWSEADRTLSFTVMTQLEDLEIGFSPEEGDFPDLPDYLIGKAWPECFGTTIRQEAVQLDTRYSGSLGEPIGLADFTLPAQIAATNAIRNFCLQLQIIWAMAQGYYSFIGADQAADYARQKQAEFIECQKRMIVQGMELNAALSEQLSKVREQFQVVGGEEFPRGSLTLEICGGLFSGSFIGSSNIFRVSDARHPDEIDYVGFNGPPFFPFESFRTKFKTIPEAEGFTISGFGSSGKYLTGNIIGDPAGPFSCQAGATVRIYGNEPLRYVVSITPGTVLSVTGWVTLPSGERVATNVPGSFWRTYTQSFGPVTAVIVEVNDALSKEEPGWEDTLYVSFRSDVGPNTVDIMKYLISRYSDLDYDEDSFNYVKGRLANYPMHFCYREKKPLIEALKELGYQNRTAVFVKNEVVFLKYLPDAEDPVHTFDESNIDVGTLDMEFTDTEELITESRIKWRSTGMQDEDNEYVVRYNVKPYGTRREEFDYYAFNKVDMVAKTAEFWAIRRGNIWKRVSFTAALDALPVETFDTCVLGLGCKPIAADVPVKSIVQFADYDSDNNNMQIELWVPVRSGSMRPFEFAYPGILQEASTVAGQPKEGTPADATGSGGPGEMTSGNINARGPRGFNGSVTYNGDPDPFNMGRGFPGGSLHNDGVNDDPTDTGDNNPGNPQDQNSGTITKGDGLPASPDSSGVQINDGRIVTVIDIRTTEVHDSNTKGTTTFDSFFKHIKGGKLAGDTGACYSDGSKDGTFDFKWDAEDNEWGAGTAFLE